MIDVVIPTRSLARAQAAVDSCSFASSVTVVMVPEWGFTRQVDQGWRGGTSPYVLFLNDDCVVNDAAIKEMLGPFGDPNVGIVGPTLRCGDYQSDIVNAPMEDGEYPLYVTVRHLIGACMLVRRTLLEKINGWDTDLKLHCSDLDLCIRAWEAGYRVVWAVQTRVDHASRQTIDEMPHEDFVELAGGDHWRFVEKHPTEELSKNGVITLRGFGKGYKVVYPKDMEPREALAPALAGG